MDPSSTIITKTQKWTGELPEIFEGQFGRLNAHHEAWVSSVASGFGHECHLISAIAGNKTVGVLPLCIVKGPLFGNFLVSLPYLNSGGVWCRDQIVAEKLVVAACDLADDLDVKHLELRHEAPVACDRLNMQRTDKVHMRLKLPPSMDVMMGSLKSKVRSQVKKSNQSQLTFEFGGIGLLADFYTVFAINMRDLGTPVFSSNLFSEILAAFKTDAEICIVRHETRPVAAALLVHANGTTEVPSASCLRAYNRLNANMFMYQQLLERAILRGSEVFDFGRSSEDSGTYKFKKQWGAKPCPATWQYYVRKGNPEDMRPDSGGKQRLIKIWQKLPVWLTKLIGPTIVRGIP